MPATTDPERVASIMLGWHDLELVSCSKLQMLWAGYGHICAITARATTEEAADRLDKICARQSGSSGSTYPLILKLISPPEKDPEEEDEGHWRKMFSYEAEQYFYTEAAHKLPDDIAVAKCLAATREMSGKEGEHELTGLIATVMTDLRPQFPVAGEKRSLLSEQQLTAALNWLGKLHRLPWNGLADTYEEFLMEPRMEALLRRLAKDSPELRVPRTLWYNGGYSHLSTRLTEYEALEADADSEWSSMFCKPVDGSFTVAEQAHSVLATKGPTHETYIHGDVKSENLFTTESGDQAAFFDFQYIGLGHGVCDIAKLFTCSVPLSMLVDKPDSIPSELEMGDGERRLLEQYRAVVCADGTHTHKWHVFIRLWETALVDWCRFQASWGFWGNTEWLQARVRSICTGMAWTSWVKLAVAEGRLDVCPPEL